MNKFEKSVVALLIVIAIEGLVTVRQIVRMAHDGFSMELSVEEAETLERVSGRKRSDYDDDDEFVYSVQDWWDGLIDKKKVEIYYQNS